MEISNYGLYISEREGFNIVESDKGFATYKINGEECYIRDIYIRPEFRDKDIAKQMLDEVCRIAKEQGCNHITGSVDTNDKNATSNLKAAFVYGYRILRNNYTMILLIKEI